MGYSSHYNNYDNKSVKWEKVFPNLIYCSKYSVIQILVVEIGVMVVVKF